MKKNVFCMLVIASCLLLAVSCQKKTDLIVDESNMMFKNIIWEENCPDDLEYYLEIMGVRVARCLPATPNQCCTGVHPAAPGVAFDYFGFVNYSAN